jgi:DNA-binding response OmpR family regulator
VRVEEEPVSLSAKETQLLLLLASNPNRIFTAEDLYTRVWGIESNSDTRTVIVHISSLRKKIEANPSSPKYIQNVRGIGYKLLGRARRDCREIRRPPKRASCKNYSS